MRPFDSSTNDPMQVFAAWLEEASRSEPNDPTAAALATATTSGVPSVRMVLTKGVDERGIRFFTNRESHKGRELSANPHTAMCFHWKTLRRQVRFEGDVRELGREETAEYFHSRSRGSQIAAAVSLQSRPLASREALDEAARRLAGELGDREVPLPQTWTGYVLVPRSVEFWSDGPDRLHDRILFTRQAQSWTGQRLFP